jgi:hypothetical protein
MRVAFVPIAELDGKEAERKGLSDKRFDLKVISHTKPNLVSLEFSGTNIAVDANQLLSALHSMTATNSTKVACA